jgi:hypothetical protein
MTFRFDKICATCGEDLEPHNPNDFCCIECYDLFKEQGGED